MSNSLRLLMTKKEGSDSLLIMSKSLFNSQKMNELLKKHMSKFPTLVTSYSSRNNVNIFLVMANPYCCLVATYNSTFKFCFLHVRCCKPKNQGFISTFNFLRIGSGCSCFLNPIKVCLKYNLKGSFLFYFIA